MPSQSKTHWQDLLDESAFLCGDDAFGPVRDAQLESVVKGDRELEAHPHDRVMAILIIDLPPLEFTAH